MAEMNVMNRNNHLNLLMSSNQPYLFICFLFVFQNFLVISFPRTFRNLQITYFQSSGRCKVFIWDKVFIKLDSQSIHQEWTKFNCGIQFKKNIKNHILFSLLLLLSHYYYSLIIKHNFCCVDSELLGMLRTFAIAKHQQLA